MLKKFLSQKFIWIVLEILVVVFLGSILWDFVGSKLISYELESVGSLAKLEQIYQQSQSRFGSMPKITLTMVLSWILLIPFVVPIAIAIGLTFGVVGVFQLLVNQESGWALLLSLFLLTYFYALFGISRSLLRALNFRRRLQAEPIKYRLSLSIRRLMRVVCCFTIIIGIWGSLALLGQIFFDAGYATVSFGPMRDTISLPAMTQESQTKGVGLQSVLAPTNVGGNADGGFTLPTLPIPAVGTSERDYSTTNIQVENVDEADVIKTDGNYIFSLVGDAVVVTSVVNATNPEIIAEITMTNSAVPEDILLAGKQLVVIGTSSGTGPKTVVNVFDLTDVSKEKLVKQFALNQDYYTSRLINDQLYVFATDHLQRFEEEDFNLAYTDDHQEFELPLTNVKYSPGKRTTEVTVIVAANLSAPSEPLSASMYLMGLDNAYISTKNIYVVDNNRASSEQMSSWDCYGGFLQKLFSGKGLLATITDRDEIFSCNRSRSNYTTIHKFALDGVSVDYQTRVTVSGQTLNQFSLDESSDGYLRIALEDLASRANGTKVVIFDANFKQVGEVTGLGRGEKMYASRFIGDRAYLVTYQTIDPLYVVDLSEPTKPRVLGELKIPGYSTYLHPYDENHLIGIGMETKENHRRDADGQIISTTASVVGMKMALFDVSDVNRPEQIDQVVIGDARTTSAILTNHKALLFSKEKELLAIPVNNYASDFAPTGDASNIESAVNSFRAYDGARQTQGYLVYQLNLQGFRAKGEITHPLGSSQGLLRGLYIDDNLYTVSQTALKIHDLVNMRLQGGLLFDETVIDSELGVYGNVVPEQVQVEAQLTQPTPPPNPFVIN